MSSSSSSLSSVADAATVTTTTAMVTVVTTAVSSSSSSSSSSSPTLPQVNNDEAEQQPQQQQQQVTVPSQQQPPTTTTTTTTTTTAQAQPESAASTNQTPPRRSSWTLPRRRSSSTRATRFGFNSILHESAIVTARMVEDTEDELVVWGERTSAMFGTTTAAVADGGDDDEFGAKIQQQQQKAMRRRRRQRPKRMLLVFIALVAMVAIVVVVFVVLRPNNNNNDNNQQTIQDTDNNNDNNNNNDESSSILSSSFAPSATPSMTQTGEISIHANLTLFQYINQTARFYPFLVLTELVQETELLNDEESVATLLAPRTGTFEREDPAFLSKYANPSWLPHVASMWRQHYIPNRQIYSFSVPPGGSLNVTNLDNGTVTFQRTEMDDDDDSSFLANGRVLFKGDKQRTNGVLHSIYTLLPRSWNGKSLWDILVEANDQRGGDLSILLSILNHTSSSSSSRLQSTLTRYGGGPTTLFAPTDAAFATATNLSALSIQNAMDNGIGSSNSNNPLRVLLENHVVSVNFVAYDWRLNLAACCAVAHEELVLTTWQENQLHLRVGGDKRTTTLNHGAATTVQNGLLSEYGVVQIIDQLLVPPGMDLSSI